MSGNEEPKVDATTKPDGAEGEHRPRRPYQTPKLRHLGSVRELTFGSMTMVTDGGGPPGNLSM